MSSKNKKFYNRKNSKRVTVAKVKSIVDKKLSQDDPGYHTISFDGAVDTLTAGYHMTSIAQGATEATRQGDGIKIVNIDARMQVTVGDASNLARILLIQWYPDNAIDVPSWNKILYSQTAGLSQVLSPFIKTHDRSKFRVLYDKVITMEASTVSANNYRKIFIDGKNLKPVEYGQNAYTGKNTLYMFVMSDSTAAPHPHCTFYGRIRFVR